MTKQTAEELKDVMDQSISDAFEEQRIEQQLPWEMRRELLLERIGGLAAALLAGLPTIQR